MARQLRGQIRNVIAIVGMLALGFATVYVIVQNQRLRIPILDERPFELKAEFETA